MRRPIVIVPACVNRIGQQAFHTVQEKYVDAAAQGARCVPLLLPALAESADLETILAAADGILLTGSPSNVHPARYGQAPRDPALALDPARDGTTLPLIRAALKRGIPLFAVCRGFQELNVALGGTLHQAVHDVDGLMDHREDKDGTPERQYAPSHRVTLAADGRLAQLLEGRRELMVNSLHGQGVDRLAAGLAVEARADDGLVEACSVRAAAGFALGVQWHPEWRFAEQSASLRLFEAFGQACRDYQRGRVGGGA